MWGFSFLHQANEEKKPEIDVLIRRTVSQIGIILRFIETTVPFVEECHPNHHIQAIMGSISQHKTDVIMKKQYTSLVTGCAGFIGSHVAQQLVSSGHEVVGLDDLSGGFTENVPDGVQFYEGSIVSKKLVDQLFDAYKFDYVFHLAAYAAEGLSHFIRNFNYSNNLLGSVNLINASINAGTVKCFVFTSSMAVYGSNQVPMHEDMPPQPEDPYGVAKYAVELDFTTSPGNVWTKPYHHSPTQRLR